MTLFRMSLFAFTLLAAQNAAALSVDDKTMNNGDTARFSDPDERMPSQVITPSYTPNAARLQNKETSPTGAVDPSSVRYEYDKDSGNYVPRSQ